MKPIICKCGCGGLVTRSARNSFCWNSYINGHNGRGKSGFWKGKCRTEETKRKIGKSLEGRHHTEATKRKMSESQVGSNHWHWKAINIHNPYPIEYRRIRESIRKRDNHTCQLCGKIKQLNGRKLDVHHIDYDKKNSNQRNLITLCHICNIQVRSDGKVWMRVFRRRVKEIYKSLEKNEACHKSSL